MDELKAASPGAVLGRPHIASRLVQLGCAADVQDAFRRFLDRGRPYYRPRQHMPLAQAVAAIRDAGGVASAAHPLQYGFDPPALEAFLLAARAAGCQALEAYYSKYSPEEQAALASTAARLGLAVTGGSDFHGDRKPDIRMGSGIAGRLRVPYSVLEALRQRL